MRLEDYKYRTYNYGVVLWLCCLQYYILQLVVAWAWRAPHFNLMRNTISDLGNTECKSYGMRMVCSPLHGLMNASFIILGLCMSIGALLLYTASSKRLTTVGGYGLIILAGVGAILVGLFPENTVSPLHILGAALSFICGNLGLLLLAYVPTTPRLLRVSGIVFGMVGIIALLAFMSHSYFGIGIGGVERIVAYPQSIWMIIYAVYVLVVKIRRNTKS